MDEDRKVKIYNFIKSNLSNFIVIISSLAYVFFTQVDIEITTESTVVLISTSILSFIIGLIVKQSIGENGITKGYSSKIWAESFEKYTNTCNLANDYLDRIDNFYLAEEIRVKKEYRRRKLMQYRMNYDWFFDDKGNYVPDETRLAKLDKQQKRALRKCINVKIYNLNLMSEYDSDEEKLTHKEVTDKDQRLKMARKNTLSQLFVAVMGAYFVPMISGWNWGAFIMSTIQIVTWIGSGVVQLYANYNYIVIDKVNKLSKKKEGIVRFVNGCKTGMYKCSPYEERTEEVIVVPLSTEEESYE